MISGFRNLDILDWEFEESDSSFMVHNACWFPAKLVPQIPAHLILNLSEAGDTVLDPFCGSGTTLIESLRHGRKCIGTDVNPVAIYISLAKCRFVGFPIFFRLTFYMKKRGYYFPTNDDRLVPEGPTRRS
jgi:hypothetical protein